MIYIGESVIVLDGPHRNKAFNVAEIKETDEYYYYRLHGVDEWFRGGVLRKISPEFYIGELVFMFYEGKNIDGTIVGFEASTDSDRLFYRIKDMTYQRIITASSRRLAKREQVFEISRSDLETLMSAV